MKMVINLIGVLLIVAGIIGLVNPNFNYEKNKKVAEVGSLKVNVDEHNTLHIPPIAGVVAVIAGLGLIYVGRRK